MNDDGSISPRSMRSSQNGMYLCVSAVDAGNRNGAALAAGAGRLTKRRQPIDGEQHGCLGAVFPGIERGAVRLEADRIDASVRTLARDHVAKCVEHFDVPIASGLRVHTQCRESIFRTSAVWEELGEPEQRAEWREAKGPQTDAPRGQGQEPPQCSLKEARDHCLRCRQVQSPTCSGFRTRQQRRASLKELRAGQSTASLRRTM